MTTTQGLGLTTSAPTSTPQTNCDGRGVFFCPTGTCYTGSDGFIGCCSVSSCAARTKCIAYPSASTINCDQNTGGCVICSNPGAPSCVTITNTVASQYIMYCAATGTLAFTGYVNSITVGSMAAAPSQAPPTSPLAMITVTATTSLNPGSSTDSIATASTSQSVFEASPANTSSSSNLTGGAIAGIAIGTAAATLALVLLALFLLHRHRRTRKNDLSSKAPLASDPDSFMDNNDAMGGVTTEKPTGRTKDNGGLGITEVEGSSPESISAPWSSESIGDRLSAVAPSDPTPYASPHLSSDTAPPQYRSGAANGPGNNLTAHTSYVPYRSSSTQPPISFISQVSTGQTSPLLSGFGGGLPNTRTSGMSTATGFSGRGAGSVGGYLSPEAAMMGGYRETVVGGDLVSGHEEGILSRGARAELG